MLYGLLVALHVLVSVILILVVLLQTGKGADLAGAFGGGGSQTAFGSRGAATVLSKMTTAAAVIFMLTSFTLAMLSSRGSASVLDSGDVPAATSTPPATPAAPAPAEPGASGDGATPEEPPGQVESTLPGEPAAPGDETPADAAGEPPTGDDQQQDEPE